MKLDGASLFGNHTFGRVGADAWKHGYEPLATLDSNTDGKLLNEELTSVWVWLDLNSNALVDEGEMKPSSEYVKSISVSATVDVKHNAEITEGAELLDGKKIQSWDWWSKSWPLNRMLDTFREGSSGEPVLAHRAASLHPPTKTHPSHIYAFANPGDQSNVGYLRFLPVGNDLYVFSLNNATPPKEAYL
ncbi:MAG: hypothetical protein ACK56K_07765, partial [Akkermansiaceae bacterium]